MMIKRKVGFMVVTEECHNACVFCGAEALGVGKMLKYDTAIQQMTDWKNSGATELIISGGEPLHHPKLLEIIRKAKEIYFSKIIMYTTADFVAGKYNPRELNEAGVDIVMVSLFGHNSKTHDGTARRKGSFENTLAGLRSFASTNIQISLNTPVNRVNYKYLPEMIEVVKANVPSKNFRGWQFSDIHPTPEANSRVNLQLNYNELQPILHDALKACLIDGINFITQEFPMCVTFPWMYETQELVNAATTVFISGIEYDSTSYYEQKPLTSSYKTYADECSDCGLKGICMGITPTYLSQYGDNHGLKAIPFANHKSLIEEAQRNWETTLNKNQSFN